MRKRALSVMALLLAALFCILPLTACGSVENTEIPAETEEVGPSDTGAIRSIEDLEGKKIGVLTGSINEYHVLRYLPDCGIEYFNSVADATVALAAGKIDAYAEDDAVMRVVLRSYPELTTMAVLCETDYASIFPKTEEGRALCEQLNEFLAKIKADGSFEKIDAVWFGEDEDAKTVDLEGLTGENGTLTMAVCSGIGEPFVYVKNREYVGYEIDLAVRFCREYGYALEFMDFDFAGLLAAISSGKCDFGAASVSVTEERAESMLFSDATYRSGSAIVVRSADLQPEETAVSVAETADKLAAEPQDGELASEEAAEEELPGEQTADGETPEETAEEPVEEELPEEESVEEELPEELAGLASRFAGKKVGVLTGSVYDALAARILPDGEAVYFNTISDLALALDSGKVDAYIADTSLVSRLTSEYRDHSVEAVLSKENYGFIFSDRNADALCGQFNEFLRELRENGTMREVMMTWFGKSNAGKTVDYSGLEDTNGTLSLAISSDVGAPFAYRKDDAYAGFDIDLAVRFCREYGYGLEIVDSNFSGLLAAVSSGRCDFGASSIVITEERKEAFCFSDPYYEGSITLVVKEAEADAADYEALRGIRIGVVTGMICDVVSESLIPDCIVEYYNGNADLGLALAMGKVDAYMTDEPVARLLLEEYPDHRTAAIVSRASYGYIFPKNSEKSDALRLQMDSFLQDLRKDGTLREIDSVWFGSDESLKTVDFSGLSGENGTLSMAVSSGVGAPFCYLKDEQYVGYDIDIAVRFCREYGYALKLEDSNFGGMLSAVSAGKCDFGGSCITITDERRESMNFSESNYDGGMVIVMRNEPENVLAELSDVSVYENLRGCKIGVLTGSVFPVLAEQTVPDCEVEQFNTNADLAIALENSKIDAYMTDEPTARLLKSEYSDQQIFATVSNEGYAYFYAKDDEKAAVLRSQMNEFLRELRENSELRQIHDIWLGGDETLKVVDYSGLTGENGTLRYAGSSGIGEPFFYRKDEQYVGYDIDIAVRFCREYGYAIEVSDYDFSGMLAAVSSGKCDFGGSCVTVTEERMESMNFSDPNYDGGVVIVTKTVDEAVGRDGSFLASVRDSFRKTFLRENRWMLFASGIGITLLITSVSALCGTALGFLLLLLYRKDHAAPNLVIRVLSDILQKTPVVVILMILYYLIFNRSALDGVWVSCIGFTLIFSCSVLDVLRVAVGAVDKGQMEAALALGYSDTRAFLRVILPQALEHFLPVYKGEVVTLIKSTAIVGYIAVQDLTKISDIIRSRTYEAFFPLIASAVIYFALAWLLTLLVSRIQFRNDPKNRDPKRILRGTEEEAGNADDAFAEGCSDRPVGSVRRETIELRHLRKAFPNAVPLADVNAVIREGDIISVIGPSGTGKSTLLRCINMLNVPTSGQVFIDGVDITAPDCRINEMRRRIGMVFQSFNLFGHLTVVENVMQAPVDLLGLSRREAYKRAMELLHMVGMDGRAMNYPDMLSGGQKQRVAIARTLAMDPEILLFDEPTSALDPTMVGEVQAVIRELARMGRTMMIVSHEMQFAREICNRVFYMDQGGVYEDGTPEQIFEQPQKERTRRFIRKLKVFQTRIDSREHDFPDTVSALERYGYKNRIPAKTLYRIQSVFEELCQQILLPRLAEPCIDFTVEYDEKQEAATAILLYGGDGFDPRQTENKLSLTIVSNQVESIEYAAAEEDGFTNRLTLRIR